MIADLFSLPEPVRDEQRVQSFSDEPCALCVSDSGEYSWDNICCRARFVTGLPGVDWRRGWMARWKSSEIPDFYSAIELAVKTRWKNKGGIVNG